ncbi:hypothetical protein J3Q64DRAFT_1700794 [Phycomyces blakesleeanus]|uniref:Uncharacterized protein n=2 Tax=Phycomyces blakesleeanus TaxID=4837 RepID=A0A167LKJ7_PHYB8|nr:hypothetical protein PHYBLDRAFT_171401 [Phycomyces blakesleeanus NRRL 1555(-)]OAD70654.1 hypothetical protein PHYBLDRAFT_171401 [Phycomyces blakesleeanus NRRL 1555(-)]|eukprot:XP_018288694.1 hypothetical protein PHYBLDRAFT_171401 [Phycomyces blakesleeanus NRRL 1555(-)]
MFSASPYIGKQKWILDIGSISVIGIITFLYKSHNAYSSIKQVIFSGKYMGMSVCLKKPSYSGGLYTTGFLVDGGYLSEKIKDVDDPNCIMCDLLEYSFPIIRIWEAHFCLVFDEVGFIPSRITTIIYSKSEPQKRKK